MLESISSPSKRFSNVLPCAEFASRFCSNLGECSSELFARFNARLLPADCCGGWMQDCFAWVPFTAFTTVIDTVLLACAIGAFVIWLVLPQDWWQGWLCGYSMLGAAILAFSLWRNTRELSMRLTFERSAMMLSQENEQLKQSSERLSSDLSMLKDTIGAIGDKGDDWIGQLRFLYSAQKRENDRQSLLLRGHARIVLLQLIQHFDSDHSLRLNQTELSAAEAFLTAGFPDIDIKHLEGKAANGGVTIADLEPLLLEHLGANNQVVIDISPEDEPKAKKGGLLARLSA